MIKIFRYGKVNPKETILIFGMGGGLGYIAKIVGDYLIESLNMKKIYSIIGDLFPYSVIVDDSIVNFLSADIYYGKCNDKELLVLSGESQPQDERAQYKFCEILFKILKKLNTKLLITVGGINVGVEPENPKVFIAGSSKEIVERFLSKDKSLDKSFFGSIVGLAGLLIPFARIYKIDAIVLLAETIGHPAFVGLRGARSILKTLNKILDLNIDLGKLEKEIEEKDKALEKYKKAKKMEFKKHEKVTYIG